MQVICHCEECNYNHDGHCKQDAIVISESVLTAAGFLPMCEDYEEETC